MSRHGYTRRLLLSCEKPLRSSKSAEGLKELEIFCDTVSELTSKSIMPPSSTGEVEGLIEVLDGGLFLVPHKVNSKV